MIKLDLMRNRAGVTSYALSKTKQNMQKQILQGIKSSPIAETQYLSIRIKDHPFDRFLTNMLDIGEEVVKATMKAEFTRAYMEDGKLTAKKYVFNDTFSAKQLTNVKEGKNLLARRGTFISKLVKNINKAIEE